MPKNNTLTVKSSRFFTPLKEIKTTVEKKASYHAKSALDLTRSDAPNNIFIGDKKLSELIKNEQMEKNSEDVLSVENFKKILEKYLLNPKGIEDEEAVEFYLDKLMKILHQDGVFKALQTQINAELVLKTNGAMGFNKTNSKTVIQFDGKSVYIEENFSSNQLFKLGTEKTEVIDAKENDNFIEGRSILEYQINPQAKTAKLSLIGAEINVKNRDLKNIFCKENIISKLGQFIKSLLGLNKLEKIEDLMQEESKISSMSI